MKHEIKFPCMSPTLVPIEKVVPNDYNPNKMEAKMSKLLDVSILDDGVTMPVVTIYNNQNDTYIIVDGENRWKRLKKLGSKVCPVSIIDKPLSDRQISTIRHNKTKGTHQLALVKKIYNDLIANPKLSLAEISKRLGLEAEEVIIYSKGATIAEEFKDIKFSNSWERNPEDKILYQNKKSDEYEEE